MTASALLVLLIVATTSTAVFALPDCVWNKDTDFPRFPPIILNSQFDFVLPVLQNGNKVVRVAAGETVTLACPGNTNVIKNLNKVEAKASCSGNKILRIDNSDHYMASLGCGNKVKEMIFQKPGKCGAGNIGTLHDIGYPISSAEKKVLGVCFDPSSETTLYTEHVIHGANIEAKDIVEGRPCFKDMGFFSVPMFPVYSQISQLNLMIHLFGDAHLAHQIIDPRRQLYFAKGHMSPDADFVIQANQGATYYYINAVPQWQAINNGNWKALEFATRKLAKTKGRDLRVYSGGWGVLKLYNKEIFLGLTENKTVVPAPAVTWKVVHDELQNCAAAIVIVNNPFLTAPPTPLCQDRCSSLPWISTVNVKDLQHGYTYCCSVADLRAAVPHVPDLGNVCLLTQ